VVAAGASCVFSVTFKPRTAGARNGAFLYIENDDSTGGDDIDVTLVGVGIAGG
jgi:hypothetical protein